MKRLVALIGLLLVELTAAVDITVTNRCSQPIWVQTDGNPTLPGGIPRVNPGVTYTFAIPSSGWVSGRMWPKTGCDDSGNNCNFGQSSPPCPAGGCHPPADTKVEFTIFPDGQSWYDVSLVDGYSLPARIVPRIQGGSCVSTDCNLDLNACPQNEGFGLGDLRVNRNGQLVACLSPCKKWNYPPPYGLAQDELLSPGVWMCCPTPPIWSPECNAGPVVQTQYVNLVRRVCPTAYSFAYDDEAGLHHCTSNTSFDVTFCH
jgi:hypothetical protein